ncbi:8-oxo-dGTP diphosphatase [Candidatus Kaiserbacteria bacterium]|nr:8-oxo-dGTP diphosphatase [Candidatus Kaiserbacteria bacterium]
MRKQLTLCIVHKNDHVLLGMKKRGFGAGRWNGFGGKVEEGESIEEAVQREMKEECGVRVSDIQKHGVLDFSFAHSPEEILEVHIFKAETFSGEPVETEEMKPQWFKTKEIPFTDMWPDDIYWVPMFLEGKKFKGRFHFGEEDVVLEKELEEI